MGQPPRDLTPDRDARSFFGAELRHWRELRQLSQDRLGLAVHVSGDTIAKIEKALRWPHDDFAAACDTTLATGGALSRLWTLVDAEHRRAERESTGEGGGDNAAGRPRDDPTRILAPPASPDVIARSSCVDAIINLLIEDVGYPVAGRGGRVVAVCGPGGFGKTTVATMVCANPRVATAFTDVLWVETGERCSAARLTALISDLCRHLGKEPEAFQDPEQAAFHLATILSGRRALLVVDNVWSGDDLAPFLVAGAHCALLVSSRNARTCPGHARVVRLDPMTRDEIAELLTLNLPGASAHHLGRLARRCGGWPLLASVVAATVRQEVEAGTSRDVAVAAALASLETVGPGAFDVWDADQRLMAIGEVLSSSLGSLESHIRFTGVGDLRERYLSLGVFPAGTAIPVDVLARWWGHAYGWPSVTVGQYCRVLVDRSLAVPAPGETGSIMLHDVFRAYVRHMAADRLTDWNSSLLAAYRPGTGSWSDLGDDQDYLWHNLAHHLREAGLYRELIRTLAAPEYIVTKARLCGYQSLAGDNLVIDHTAGERPRDNDASEEVRAARLLTSSGFLLRGMDRPSDMASTLLVACLRHDAAPAVERLRHMAGDTRYQVEWARPGQWRDVGPEAVGHVGAVTGVQVSNSTAASVGEDGTVRLWDLRSGAQLHARWGHTGWLYAVAMSHDGQLVATAGDDGLIRLWRTETAEPVGVLVAHSRRVRALAFTSREHLLVSAGEDGRACVWSPDSGSLVRDLDTPAVPVWSLAIDPSDTWVAMGGEDGRVRLYDISTGALSQTSAEHPDWVRVVAFGARKPLLASAFGSTVRTWDLRNGDLHLVSPDREVPGRVRCAAFTGDDEAVAVGTESATLHLLPLAAPHQPTASAAAPTGVDWIRSVAVAPNGRILTGCEDGALRTWDGSHRSPLRLMANSSTTVWSTGLLANRGLALHGLSDGVIQVCDQSGAVRSRLSAGDGRVWSLAAAGAHVAATCGDDTVRVWGGEGFELIVDLGTGAGRTWAVVLDRAGTRLAASSADGTVRVWDLLSGSSVACWAAHSGRIRSMAFDASGDLLATAGGDGTARLWRVSELECVAEIADHHVWARCVDLDDAGRRLAVGYGPGEIHVHDVITQRRLAKLRGHNGRVLMLGLGAGRGQIVSAAADGTVRVWSIEESMELAQVRVDASLNCAAFDSVSRTALVGSAGGVAAIRMPDTAPRREDSLG